MLTYRRTLNQSRSESSIIALEGLLELYIEDIKNKLLTCSDEKTVIRLQGAGESYRKMLDAIRHPDFQVDK